MRVLARRFIRLAEQRERVRQLRYVPKQHGPGRAFCVEVACVTQTPGRQEPRRGAGVPAAFSGQSAIRYFRENLKFATGLVGVV